MSTIVKNIETNPENLWRLETPGDNGWERTARPGPEARQKYFIVSCDTHLPPPAKLFLERLDERHHSKLARVELRDGVRYMVTPAGRSDPLVEAEMQGEDLVRNKAGAAFRGDANGEFNTLDQRIAYQDMDGVDAEVLFPNGPALMIWASEDVEFVADQCRVWNDWQMEFCRPRLDRCAPAAAIPTLDVEAAIREVERAAKLGYKVLTLPNRAHWGIPDGSKPNYNDKSYEPLWAAIQDHDLTITFHAATGKDPRAVKGFGGAIINYVVHGCMEVIEPIVTLCASGIMERFPRLRAVAVEGNAGWVPWMMDMMDEAHLKHHFWTRPKLKELPSTYFRTNGGVVLGEDHSACLAVEPYRLENNMMWANDFPHHEGTWPHSAEAIERIFGDLREDTRAKVLGLNASRFFGLQVPEKYL